MKQQKQLTNVEQAQQRVEEVRAELDRWRERAARHDEQLQAVQAEITKLEADRGALAMAAVEGDFKAQGKRDELRRELLKLRVDQEDLSDARQQIQARVEALGAALAEAERAVREKRLEEHTAGYVPKFQRADTIATELAEIFAEVSEDKTLYALATEFDFAGGKVDVIKRRFANFIRWKLGAYVPELNHVEQMQLRASLSELCADFADPLPLKKEAKQKEQHEIS